MQLQVERKRIPVSKNELILLILIYPKNIHHVALLEVGKEHKSPRTPHSTACSTFKRIVPPTLMVLLVTLGRRSGAFLLVGSRVHSAAQASAVAHMSEHPGPEVREAAVLRQHDPGPWIAFCHVQSCNGQSSAHLWGSRPVWFSVLVF